MAHRGGVPLAVVLTAAADVHDSSKVLEEVEVDAIEPIKRPGRGRHRKKRPKKLHAEKGYDFSGAAVRRWASAG